jgi:quercetin dioxygenase-like cupin family protein
VSTHSVAPTNGRAWPELVALEALGVLPVHEAEKVRTHLRTCEKCMLEYKGNRAAVDLLGYLSEDAEFATVPPRPERLKARVLRAAQAARQPISPSAPQPMAAYAHFLVESDELLDFSPGIKWAVTRGDGVTLVQWLFEPPECGEVPDEVHALTQAGVVLEGSFSMHYGDGTIQRFGKQDVYLIAPGTVHGAEFHERTILFDIYTPNHIQFEEMYLEQLREREEAAKK